MKIKAQRIKGQEKLLKQGYEATTFDIPINRGVLLHANSVEKVSTGYKFQLPEGYDMVIFSRSSTFKRGLNISGYIDNDYRGEVFFIIHYSGNGSCVLKKGDYPAQCRLIKKIKTDIEYGDIKNNTKRGDKGFGSTDKK